MFYYKNGNSYLKTKQELKGAAIGEWVKISEEEYQASHPKKQINQNLVQIEKLKKELAKTDYQCLKWSEGWLTDEEYAPIKAQRQALRDRINELEESEPDQVVDGETNL